MSVKQMKEIDEVIQRLRTHGPVTLNNFLVALLIWLFGVLVFIPAANSLSWQTRLLTSLTIFVAFTIFMYRAIFGFKKLIDAFSFFPARKYGLKRGIDYENALTMFRYAFYIILSLVVYALYFPFLTGFHSAISGIVLIMILIWFFFLTLRILSILAPKILERLKYD